MVATHAQVRLLELRFRQLGGDFSQCKFWFRMSLWRCLCLLVPRGGWVRWVRRLCGCIYASYTFLVSARPHHAPRPTPPFTMPDLEQHNNQPRTLFESATPYAPKPHTTLGTLSRRTARCLRANIRVALGWADT